MKIWSLLVVAVLLIVASAAMADDGTFTWTFETMDQQSGTHEDGPDWKGFAFVNVTNSTDQAWGSFSFGIFNGPGVIITDTPAPTSSLSNFTWQIGEDNTTLDYFFHSNPVNPGESVSFTFYTDNTLNKNAFFGIYGAPGPVVPEPGSLLAISSGLVGMAGFALRRRK